MTDWCILTTAARSTLRLAGTLAADGFEVWTPVETRTIEVPRMNAKREVRLPILEGFIFASFDQRHDLDELASMPVKPRRGPTLLEPAHADFSVFRFYDRIPKVRDEHLANLRRLEARKTPFRKAERALPEGARVRANDGSFGGLIGTVRRSNEAVTLVCFSRWFDRVEIQTSLLIEDEGYALQSTTDTAARRAA